MVATLPVNRIVAHYDSPPIARPVVPKGERARGQLWSDVVFEAVLALRNQLTSRCESVAAAAANSILELERTRMRHAKPLAGSRSLTEAQEEFERDPSGMALDHGEPEREFGGIGGDPRTCATPVPPVSVAPEEHEPEDECEFDNHTRTVRNYFADKLARPMTAPESVEFVCEKLRGWMLTAASVPRDKFIEQMRFCGDLPKVDPIWECGAGRRRAGV